jgi:hypothetical protein
MKEKLTKSQKAFRKLPKVDQFYQLVLGQIQAKIKSNDEAFLKAKTQKESNAVGRVGMTLIDIEITVQSLYKTFFEKK